MPKVPAKKKEPIKGAAAQKKKPLAAVSEISDDDDDNDINEIDEDFELEIVASLEAGKKGGEKTSSSLRHWARSF